MRFKLGENFDPRLVPLFAEAGNDVDRLPALTLRALVHYLVGRSGDGHKEVVCDEPGQAWSSLT